MSSPFPGVSQRNGSDRPDGLRRPDMLVEDEGDVQKEDRGALKRKPTGPPRLLLDRTRSTKVVRSEENPEGTAARCSASGPEGAEDLTCGGRHRSRKRSRWWSRFSSTVLCIRKEEEVSNRLESPSEEALQKPEVVPPNQRGDTKETKVKMRKVLRRFIPSDVLQAQNLSPGDKSPKSFQEKLQKFFIRGGRRRSDPLGHLEDTRVEEDRSKPNKPLKKETDGSLDPMMVTPETKVQLMESPVAEDPEPPAVTPEEVLTRTEQDMVQTVDINQVISEDTEDISDSQVLVDLHDLLQSEVHPEEKTTQTSQSAGPSMNGPSIQIEVCPTEDFTQETEEETWTSVSPSENHLHLLFGLDLLSERQLRQVASSLVRTATSAALDQLSREQQDHDEDLRRTSEVQTQRRGPLPAPTSPDITF